MILIKSYNWLIIAVREIAYTKQVFMLSTSNTAIFKGE